MGNMVKGSLLVLCLFTLVGILGFGGNSDAELATIEINDASEALHSSPDDGLEMSIQIPPDPEPTFIEEIANQDHLWWDSSNKWISIITEDSEEIMSSLANMGASTGASMDTSMDISEIIYDGYLVQTSCKLALEESQGYDVSLSLQYNKDEYESGLEDYALAMEQIQSAMDSLNSNESDAFSSHLELAGSYMASAENHMYATSHVTFAGTL